jgi:hypothetical protein
VLPPITRQKYAERLAELIRRGEAVPVSNKTITSDNWVTGKTTSRRVETIDWEEFVKWRTNCLTLLDQLLPSNSVHRVTAEQFKTIKNNRDSLQFGIQFLKAISEDFDQGLFVDIGIQIETEIAADYLGQAKKLVESELREQISSAPAAVLAGVVLEKCLRSMCEHLSPPEPTTSNNGKPLTLNPLIDALRKRGAFNEGQAKHLRTWAHIRNNAAHGQLEEFTTDQVISMIKGIESFLEQSR